jgi:hypothetical protein
MVPSADLDDFSLSDLKSLVLKLFEEVGELRRIVAAQRDQIARLKGGPGRPNIKPSGMDKGTEPKGSPLAGRRAAPEGQQDVEVVDRRGAKKACAPSLRTKIQAPSRIKVTLHGIAKCLLPVSPQDSCGGRVLPDIAIVKLLSAAPCMFHRPLMLYPTPCRPSLRC